MSVSEPTSPVLTDDEVRAKYMSCMDCGMPAKTRGLCGTHYQQARRGGYLSDYPREEVYQRGFVIEVVEQALNLHGQIMLDEIEEAIAAYRAMVSK